MRFAESRLDSAFLDNFAESIKFYVKIPPLIFVI